MVPGCAAQGTVAVGVVFPGGVRVVGVEALGLLLGRQVHHKVTLGGARGGGLNAAECRLRGNGRGRSWHRSRGGLLQVLQDWGLRAEGVVAKAAAVVSTAGGGGGHRRQAEVGVRGGGSIRLGQDSKGGGAGAAATAAELRHGGRAATGIVVVVGRQGQGAVLELTGEACQLGKLALMELDRQLGGQAVLRVLLLGPQIIFSVGEHAAGLVAAGAGLLPALAEAGLVAAGGAGVVGGIAGALVLAFLLDGGEHSILITLGCLTIQ